MTDIGAKIKQLRIEHNLTMDLLVEDIKEKYPEIAIDKSLLSRWENGQNEPTLEKAKYLSLYFNVSLDYLIGLTDIRTPSRLLAKRFKNLSEDK